MAANLIARYVWLVDLLLHHRNGLTYNEINTSWQDRNNALGDGNPLPLRTFHNHKNAIQEIFDILIDCDKSTNRYFISDPENLKGDKLRSWIIASYSTLNQIKADKKLENRIIFEHMPSGHVWLDTIIEAMRKNKVLNIVYQAFGKIHPTQFKIEPYYLRVVKRRWYVVARCPEYAPQDIYRIYALDRIKDIQQTDLHFTMNKDFDAETFFKGSCGVIVTDDPIERIVIKAYWSFPDYLRTLPLHPSQKELGPDGDGVLFEYHLKPTFDLYQMLLMQGDQLEVIEPTHVRDEMRQYAIKILERNKN